MFVDFNILNQLGSPSINSNTFANRPAAGQTGRLFVSTDTFELYRDNGTGWDLIGGPGSSTVTGSGAAGQVTYWTGASTIGGNNNLFWDTANSRLGIGTATPGTKLDIHTTSGTAASLNSTNAVGNVYTAYQNQGTTQYLTGYTDDADINYRRFVIYDSIGAKETITIDQQSRYVGINFQYSSLTDQPQYMLDLSGGSFHTNVGQYLVGTPTDLTRAFAASGNANSIALWLEEYGNTVNSADIFFNKGRGTDIAKLPVLVGDNLGAISFSGYVNNTFASSLNIDANVTNIDNVNNQANADFIITQSYNSPTRTENFRIIANGGNGYLRGNFGIGNQNPSNKLTVSVISGTAQDAINWSDGSRNGYLYIDGGGVGIFSGATATNQGIYFNNTASYIDFFTSSSTRATITSAGLFGIGTSTPNANLVVQNISGTAIPALGSQGGHFQLQNGTYALLAGVATSGNGWIQVQRTDGTATAYNLLLQPSGGNVLIGTTTDNGDKLQVNGNVNVRSSLPTILFDRNGSYTWRLINGDGVTYSLSTFNIVNNGGTAIANFTDSGNALFAGSIKTGAPTGGTAAAWKLGSYKAAAVVVSTTNYIEVDIGGTLYKLAVVT